MAMPAVDSRTTPKDTSRRNGFQIASAFSATWFQLVFPSMSVLDDEPSWRCITMSDVHRCPLSE